MPGFQENLVGVGPMCDVDYKVTFNKHAVNIYSPTETPITTGWRKDDSPRLWRIYLMPTTEDIP